MDPLNGTSNLELFNCCCTLCPDIQAKRKVCDLRFSRLGLFRKSIAQLLQWDDVYSTRVSECFEDALADINNCLSQPFHMYASEKARKELVGTLAFSKQLCLPFLAHIRSIIAALNSSLIRIGRSIDDLLSASSSAFH